MRFKGLTRGDARTASGPGFASGSGFMGSIRRKSKTAFGPGCAAGSRCKGLSRGDAEAASRPDFASGSGFKGLIRRNVDRGLRRDTATSGRCSLRRSCLTSVGLDATISLMRRMMQECREGVEASCGGWGRAANVVSRRAALKWYGGMTSRMISGVTPLQGWDMRKGSC